MLWAWSQRDLVSNSDWSAWDPDLGPSIIPLTVSDPHVEG